MVWDIQLSRLVIGLLNILAVFLLNQSSVLMSYIVNILPSHWSSLLPYSSFLPTFLPSTVDNVIPFVLQTRWTFSGTLSHLMIFFNHSMTQFPVWEPTSSSSFEVCLKHIKISYIENQFSGISLQGLYSLRIFQVPVYYFFSKHFIYKSTNFWYWSELFVFII